MDNLTHSLFGALLGQMGLKRKTGLGMPTLVIAANLPDIDAACSVYGTLSLAMRRGLTHGPIALLLLPPLLCLLMLGFDRWQARRGTRPPDRLPVRPGWLLALAYIGAISHPALDWLNSYGIRLLEPFSSRWFHGDTLFIIDAWIWALLIGGLIWSYRAERRDVPAAQSRARWLFAVACTYILANGMITGTAERRTADWVRRTIGLEPALVVANPVPLAFWRRDMLWRAGDRYGSRPFDLTAGTHEPGPEPPLAMHTGMDDPAIARARINDPAARAFLFWSRMPVATRDPAGGLVLRDQRFTNALVRGSFTVTVPAERLR